MRVLEPPNRALPDSEEAHRAADTGSEKHGRWSPSAVTYPVPWLSGGSVLRAAVGSSCGVRPGAHARHHAPASAGRFAELAVQRWVSPVVVAVLRPAVLFSAWWEWYWGRSG